jgi:hypothetical protein
MFHHSRHSGTSGNLLTVHHKILFGHPGPADLTRSGDLEQDRHGGRTVTAAPGSVAPVIYAPPHDRHRPNQDEEKPEAKVWVEWGGVEMTGLKRPSPSERSEDSSTQCPSERSEDNQTQRWGAPAVAGTGLVVVVVGTFLPWSRSGMTYRNSYASLGVLRELGFIGGVVTVWVAMIPLVAVVIAAYALGLRRSAAGVATVMSILLGTISGVAAVQGSDEGSLIGIASSGPTTTLVGAVLALLGAVVVLVTQRKRSPGGEP